MIECSRETMYGLIDEADSWRTVSCVKKHGSSIFVTQYYDEDGMVIATATSTCDTTMKVKRSDYKQIERGWA